MSPLRLERRNRRLNNERGFSGAQRLWLEHAQELGFIGPKPIEGIYEHALGFGQCIDELTRVEILPPSFVCADLGSGAGIPGLFLASWFPESRFVLVESMRKRYLFLQATVLELGLGERVDVFAGRSEELAQSRTGGFHLVTSRGFAPPSPTAENASGLLDTDGILLVSEPPFSKGERWPQAGLELLGFSPAHLFAFQYSYSWMLKSRRARGRFPREVGVPERAPLF